MSNELKYYKVTRDDGNRYITSEQITQNGDTVQRVYKEPASWSNAGQRGEYLESTFIRPKDWPTTGKRRQYYTPSGKGIDDPWFFEPGTQESFDSMWKIYEEYRSRMKNPQSKLPKLNRPDQVESKQPGGLIEQPKIGVEVPQAQSAIEPQIGAIKSIGYKESEKAPETPGPGEARQSRLREPEGAGQTAKSPAAGHFEGAPQTGKRRDHLGTD